MINRPKIVFTNPIPEDIVSKIQMTNEQFIKFVLNDRISVIFGYYTDPNRTNHNLYVVKEGVFFITIRGRDNYKNFAEFYNIREEGFSNFNQYLEAYKYGITNYHEFQAFKNSKFFGIGQNPYQDYLEGRKGGFNSPEDLRDAKRYGICESEEYYAFKYSKYHNYDDFRRARQAGFKEKSEYETALSLGIKTYEEFMKFRNSGFKDYKNYTNAMDLGFKNKREYETAQKLGFKNIHEFLIFLEKKFVQIDEKVNQLRKNAYEAIQSEKLDNYIQLKWAILEELTKKLYLKLFKEESLPEQKVTVDELLIKIEEKLNKYIFDREELNKWFFLQKRIDQGRAVLNSSQTQKAKKFFDELYETLEEIFKSI